MMKTNSISTIIFATILSLISFSCTTETIDKDINFKLSINPTINGEEFNLNKDYVVKNDKLRFEEFKYYISDIYLIKGTEKTLIKDLHIIDYSKEKSSNFITTKVKFEQYDAIEFNIGLNADQNSTDQTLVSSNHPLGIESAMFWSWATMYKFISIEGKQGGSDDNSLQNSFLWHPGKASLLRNKKITLKQSLLTNPALNLNLEISKISHGENPIDFKTESVTHSTDNTINIAHKIADNFAKNITIEK